MIPRAIELDLPLGEPATDEVARDDRVDHIRAIPGVDVAAAERLARVFPSLAAVYSASEERLAEAVGPVTAARMRWFLDAPLSAAALPGRRPRRVRTWHHAA
jgi:ERCC4-type nuclease